MAHYFIKKRSYNSWIVWFKDLNGEIAGCGNWVDYQSAKEWINGPGARQARINGDFAGDIINSRYLELWGPCGTQTRRYGW